MASIFTKIIQGTIPCYKIYENTQVFAFLDIRPIHVGHALVVPKIEVDYFLDAEDSDYAAVFAATKVIGKAIHAATHCRRVGLMVQGFEVPHFHVHLVPMWKIGDLDLSHGRERPADELADMQGKIVKALGTL